MNLEQIRLADLDPEQAAEIEFGAVAPVDVTLRVASDAENIYMLVEVPTAFVYNAEEHNLSPSLAVQFPIEESSSTHMGAEEADLYASGGMVDLWHWELQCAAARPRVAMRSPEATIRRATWTTSSPRPPRSARTTVAARWRTPPRRTA